MALKKNVQPSKLKEFVEKLNIQGGEVHCTLYDDGIWKIDFERHPYGCIRFWVSREDANGNFNQSLFTPLGIDNDGNLRYEASFKVKKTVVNKMKAYYIAIEKYIHQ